VVNIKDAAHRQETQSQQIIDHGRSMTTATCYYTLQKTINRVLEKKVKHFHDNFYDRNCHSVVHRFISFSPKIT
jgi:hypothetical protein